MPQQSFWGATNAENGASYNDVGEYTDGITVPTGRAMANGDVRVLITGIVMYLGALGSGRTATIYVGSSSLNIPVPAASGLQAVGGPTTTRTLLSPGSIQVGSFKAGGTQYFGRKAAAGRTVVARDGANWPNWSHAGYYDWAQAPAAPVIGTITIDGQIATVPWSVPDNGGVAINGYQLQYSQSSTFASGVTSVNLGTGTSTNVTLPTPGMWYFRIAAKNEVTDKASTVGPRSATKSALIPSGGYHRQGGAWRPRVRRWRSGSEWRIVRRWYRDSGMWKPVK